VTLVVIITVRPGASAALRAYEQRAAAIMARYGGAIERNIAVPSPGSGELAQEIHIVTFPDEAALRAYQNDGELAALSAQRAAAIEQTEIYRGYEAPRYGATQPATATYEGGLPLRARALPRRRRPDDRG
jgi:uncharacterized protein (DUF1330 family)